MNGKTHLVCVIIVLFFLHNLCFYIYLFFIHTYNIKVIGRSYIGCVMIAGRSPRGCILVVGRSFHVISQHRHKVYTMTL